MWAVMSHYTNRRDPPSRTAKRHPASATTLGGMGKLPRILAVHGKLRSHNGYPSCVKHLQARRHHRNCVADAVFDVLRRRQPHLPAHGGRFGRHQLLARRPRLPGRRRAPSGPSYCCRCHFWPLRARFELQRRRPLRLGLFRDGLPGHRCFLRPAAHRRRVHGNRHHPASGLGRNDGQWHLQYRLLPYRFSAGLEPEHHHRYLGQVPYPSPGSAADRPYHFGRF